MTLRFKDMEIENLNQYPEPVVAALREALRSGARAVPDPKRTNFYELQVDGYCYYIDVLEEARKVLLLSVWPSAVAAK